MIKRALRHPQCSNGTSACVHGHGRTPGADLVTIHARAGRRKQNPVRRLESPSMRLRALFGIPGPQSLDGTLRGVCVEADPALALLWNHPDLLEHHQLVERLPLFDDLCALEARDDQAGEVDLLAGRLDVLKRAVVRPGSSEMAQQSMSWPSGTHVPRRCRECSRYS